jgi:hypothetical protein
VDHALTSILKLDKSIVLGMLADLPIEGREGEVNISSRILSPSSLLSLLLLRDFFLDLAS